MLHRGAVDRIHFFVRVVTRLHRNRKPFRHLKTWALPNTRTREKQRVIGDGDRERSVSYSARGAACRHTHTGELRSWWRRTEACRCWREQSMRCAVEPKLESQAKREFRQRDFVHEQDNLILVDDSNPSSIRRPLHTAPRTLATPNRRHWGSTASTASLLDRKTRYGQAHQSDP